MSRPLIEFEPASVGMVSWVAANMRPIDRREIYCQLDHESPRHLAYHLVYASPRIAEVACVQGAPAVAYGVTEVRPGYGELWAFGIPGIMYRALPAVTRRIRDVHWRTLVGDRSVQRVECRSIAEHVSAHKWIESIDLDFVCKLPCWGKGGEDFLLFARTRRELDERMV